MKKKEESYEKNLRRLEELVETLEADEAVSIDALREKMAEAKAAYAACQAILRETEEEAAALQGE